MNGKKQNNLQFSDILASSVHDMKNSIAMLLNTLDEVLAECDVEASPAMGRLSDVQYEARRANTNLIQLLTLYKVDEGQYTPNITHHSVYDLLEETLITAERLLRVQGITGDVDCGQDLYWFLDADLIYGVLNNVINNTFRYARKQIRLSAREMDGYLILGVEDDGQGYPASMIYATDVGMNQKTVNFSSGSTGLGLYFAATVAHLHSSGQKRGYIQVENGGAFNGGYFRIALP